MAAVGAVRPGCRGHGAPEVAVDEVACLGHRSADGVRRGSEELEGATEHAAVGAGLILVPLVVGLTQVHREARHDEQHDDREGEEDDRDAALVAASPGD